MKKEKKSGIIALAVVLAITVVIAAVNLVGARGSSVMPVRGAKKAPSFERGGYIAELHIEGVIQEANQTYNQEWLLSTIDMLKADRKNRGIALFIDSPGGTVYEADEAYLALQDYKTSGKKLYVYQAQLAASGGYYISCAADKIYANRNTLTGSIGVIYGSSIDLSGLFEKIGIKSQTIHAGKNKNMMNYNEPFTDEQKEIVQSVADAAYEQFTGIVAMSRNIPLFEVKKLADGRIYTAKQALDNKLVDKIDSWENMIKDMRDNEFGGKNFQVKKFEYKRSQTLRDMLLEKALGAENSAALSKLSGELTMQYPAYLYR